MACTGSTELYIILSIIFSDRIICSLYAVDEGLHHYCRLLMIDPNSVKVKRIQATVGGGTMICVVLCLAKFSTAWMSQPRKFNVSLV